jgi:hypothetical protein
LGQIFSSITRVYFCLSTADWKKAVDTFFWESSFTDVNIDKLCLFLRRQDWISVAHVNAKYDAFIKIFLAGFQNFFPMVKKIQRAYQQGKVVGSIAMCEKAACGIFEVCGSGNSRSLHESPFSTAAQG